MQARVHQGETAREKENASLGEEEGEEEEEGEVSDEQRD